uniref:GOLD domain-containing protein n=1 Tax=Panagrellus redivivus TaxID=6233 RepID=A0A7E4VS48_PANRE
MTTILWGLVVALLMPTSQALSVYTNYGPERVKFGTLLSFYVTSKSEMHCFYEELKKGADLKASLTSIDDNEHEVHLRVTSPSAEYSEWKHGKNVVRQEFKVEEEGVYEVCATARVNYGQLRMNLQFLAYVPDEIEKVAVAQHEELNARTNINDKINLITTKIYSMIFLQKQMTEVMTMDEHMQKTNSYFIDSFSIIQSCVILFVGIGQTIAIRRFFNVDPKKIGI